MKPSVAFESQREAIRQIVRSHNAGNPRVFGSVVCGEDTDDSDLDLLVDPTPETSLLDIARIQIELERMLGVTVDVLTPDALPVTFRGEVLRQAKPV